MAFTSSNSRESRWSHHLCAISAGFVIVSASSQAAEQSFEGIVGATEVRGGTSTQTLYTAKGNELRIENVAKTKPEPINIIDLAAKKLTIVYPHNSCFVLIDLARTPSVAGVGDPGGRPPDASSPLGPGSTSPPTIPAKVGSAISPPAGFPTPPPMPSMPPRPNNPMASGMPAMPDGMPMPLSQGFSAPGMLPMPGMGGFEGAPELTKTGKTRKIQGFDCTLYTISDDRGTFEIWATPDSGLFPFRLVQATPQNRRFGPRMLEEQWVELLQKQSLFPIEAILRTNPQRPVSRAKTNPAPKTFGASDPGPPLLAFKVDKIERKKIDDGKLFQPPESYFEIQSPTL